MRIYVQKPIKGDRLTQGRISHISPGYHTCTFTVPPRTPPIQLSKVYNSPFGRWVLVPSFWRPPHPDTPPAHTFPNISTVPPSFPPRSNLPISTFHDSVACTCIVDLVGLLHLVCRCWAFSVLPWSVYLFDFLDGHEGAYHYHPLVYRILRDRRNVWGSRFSSPSLLASS